MKSISQGYSVGRTLRVSPNALQQFKVRKSLGQTKRKLFDVELEAECEIIGKAFEENSRALSTIRQKEVSKKLCKSLPEFYKVEPNHDAVYNPLKLVSISNVDEYWRWLLRALMSDEEPYLELPGYYFIEADGCWFSTLSHECLTEEQCDAIINLVLITRRAVPRIFKYQEPWSCIESLGWSALICEDISKVTERILPNVFGTRPIQGGLPWDKAKKVYGIGFVKPGHWVLYEIIFEEEKIVVYDSMSKTTNWDRVKQCFRNVVRNVAYLSKMVGLGGKKKEFELARFNHPPQQINDKDCGIMALKFFECLVTPYEISDVEPERVWEYRELYGAALWRIGLNLGGVKKRKSNAGASVESPIML